MSKQPAVSSRQSRSELEWRDRLSRYATSDQTVQAFCASESISKGMFYHWQARLRERGMVIAKPRVRSKTSTQFIEAGTIPRADFAGNQGPPESNINQEARFDIRLELGGGVVLHVVRR